MFYQVLFSFLNNFGWVMPEKLTKVPLDTCSLEMEKRKAVETECKNFLDREEKNIILSRWC